MCTAVYHEGVCTWSRQDLGHIDFHANWGNSVHMHRTSLTHSAIWTLKETWIYGCEGSGLKLNGYVCCKHMHAHWFGALWGMCPLKNVWFTVDVTVQHVGKMDYMFPCTKLKSLGKIAVWKEFERKKEKVKKEQTLGRRQRVRASKQMHKSREVNKQELVWWMNEWTNKRTSAGSLQLQWHS